MNIDAVHLDATPAWRRRLARAGRLGFWFFFLKGLAWLVVPAAVWVAGLGGS